MEERSYTKKELDARLFDITSDHRDMEDGIKTIYELLWSAFGLIALLMVCVGLMVAILHAKGIC
nr:hypothetical protein [Prevotella sp.]